MSLDDLMAALASENERADKADIEREDALSYAAEIAQGVTHHFGCLGITGKTEQPCVRCRMEAAETEVARLREALSIVAGMVARPQDGEGRDEEQMHSHVRIARLCRDLNAALAEAREGLRIALRAIGYVPHMAISDEASQFVGDTRRKLEALLTRTVGEEFK